MASADGMCPAVNHLVLSLVDFGGDGVAGGTGDMPVGVSSSVRVCSSVFSNTHDADLGGDTAEGCVDGAQGVYSPRTSLISMRPYCLRGVVRVFGELRALSTLPAEAVLEGASLGLVG